MSVVKTTVSFVSALFLSNPAGHSPITTYLLNIYLYSPVPLLFSSYASPYPLPILSLSSPYPLPINSCKIRTR
ncbi:MAG: hypothetical protein LWX70_01370 [Sphingobacteriia bacterium]|nr:hypothetical protein [Sphingobacteriia bacterium]